LQTAGNTPTILIAQLYDVTRLMTFSTWGNIRWVSNSPRNHPQISNFQEITFKQVIIVMAFLATLTDAAARLSAKLMSAPLFVMQLIFPSSLNRLSEIPRPTEKSETSTKGAVRKGREKSMRSSYILVFSEESLRVTVMVPF